MRLGAASAVALQASVFIRFMAQIEHHTVACPIRAQYTVQLRSLRAIEGQPFSLHVRKLPSQSLSVLVFQAGHASSILVTRSAVKALVKGLFCVTAMPLRGCPPRLGHYAGHRVWLHQLAP
jgi:hypothetical protein